MIIEQTPVFTKQKKKLHRQEIQALDHAVLAIASHPHIGESKHGDLSSIRVYKYKLKTQEYLIAYKIINANKIVLIAFGTHENFYRDLKKYLH